MLKISDILIHTWGMGEQLKNCCDKWTLVAQHYQKYTTWVHLLAQILSHLALAQVWIKISSWNFHHLFIMSLCKSDKKNFGIAQLACQPGPISSKTLEASSNRICSDVSKRKQNGEVLDPGKQPIERNFRYF